MDFASNNIIIVDDVEEDIDRLTDVFCKNGIGCRPFQYDGLDFPKDPLRGVKFAFFDINLTNAGDDKARMATLADAINKYISPDNKAYVLIFWTRNQKDVKNFINYISRDKAPAIPIPLDIKVLDKSEFIKAKNKDDADRENGDIKAVTNVEQKLNEIMDNSLVKCLFEFENQLVDSSETCLQDLMRIIPSPTNYSKLQDYTDNVRKLFSLMAKKYSGNQKGGLYPDLAIRQVFAPLFLHKLLQEPAKPWKEFLTNIDKVKIGKELNIATQLNTIFHIDLNNNREKDSRGSVRVINTKRRRVSFNFKARIGMSWGRWLIDVMLNKKKYLLGMVKHIICLEISPACDYANGKPRTHRYILGIITQQGVIKKELKEKNEKMPDAFYTVSGAFRIGDDDIEVHLHLNSVITEEKDGTFKILGDKLFGFKNELMNKICDDYANHTTRLGIDMFS